MVQYRDSEPALSASHERESADPNAQKLFTTTKTTPSGSPGKRMSSTAQVPLRIPS